MTSSADLAAIHTAFARPVTFTGGGVTNAAIGAVLSVKPAPAFLGPGQTIRQRTYEIRKADVAQQPVKGATLVDEGTSWRVIEVTDRADVEAWLLGVERAE